MEYEKSDSIQKEFSLLGELNGPVQVSFDITSNCNLKCIHCYNDSGSNSPVHELSDEEILLVAKQVADLHPINVCLCGGEPLCRKNIFDIMDTLRGNVAVMSMVSNGYIMTEDMVKKLLDHGMTNVQISLDGVNKYQHDTFRGVLGAFDRAVGAINNLKKHNMKRIMTSFVPNRLNQNCIEEYVEMCYQLGVDTIRLMPLIPSGRARTLGRILLMNNMEYFKFQRKLDILTNKYAGKIQIEWGDPIDHLRRMPFNTFNGMKTYCMEVKANGDITATTYLPIIVGNCMKHSLREYWDKGYNYIWRNYNILKYTEQIQTVDDFNTFEPAPYSGEFIRFDLIDANLI